MHARYFRAITFTFTVGTCVVLGGGLLGAFRMSRRSVRAAESPPDNFHAVDDYITARMETAQIPGLSVAIVQGDQIVYLKGYGHADPSGRAVTPQTPFIIGSISKTFTALAIMQLVEAGQVELDAPVQRYLPWFRVADPPQASAQITVRSLLNHTSGLPQKADTFIWTDQDAGVLERSVRYLKTVALARPIGTYGYSNANYQILGLIIQTVTGQSYEAYVEQHIFAPLEMRTSFASQEEAQRHGMATGYRWWFGVPLPATLPYLRAELPAGYLISSAQDMAHYLIALMQGGQYQGRSILSPQGMAFLQTRAAGVPYGNGWELATLNGRTLVNQDGATANFQASMFFDPQARVGVFIAANVMNALDGLSSPQGSATFASITTRGIAESVLSLATHQPVPDQGLGIERISLIYDLLVLALTGVLVLALVRMPRRYRRLAQRGIGQWSDLARRSGWIAALHFAWPAALLYVALTVPEWKELVWFQPDLTYWLAAIAVVVALKGGIELALVWRIFGLARQGHIHALQQAQNP